MKIDTWLPADADPPCAGRWDLFDSTDRRDHVIAKRLCAGCPIRLQCRTAARAERGRSEHGPVGTWGGTLYGGQGRPRRDAA